MLTDTPYGKWFIAKLDIQITFVQWEEWKRHKHYWRGHWLKMPFRANICQNNGRWLINILCELFLEWKHKEWVIHPFLPMYTVQWFAWCISPGNSYWSTENIDQVQLCYHNLKIVIHLLQMRLNVWILSRKLLLMYEQNPQKTVHTYF